jgi:hypothetical protein
VSSPHPQTPFESNDTDLREIKNYLCQSKTFLANQNLADNVEWVEFGRQRKLVMKNAKDADAIRDPAIIEWVGEISPNNFWLYPCAGWNGERGPNSDWEKRSPFELAKARAVVRRPSHALFTDDWKKCIANINRLMAMAKHPNSKTALSILQDADIKIRHSIFELKERSSVEKESTDDERSDNDTIRSSNSEPFSYQIQFIFF